MLTVTFWRQLIAALTLRFVPSLLSSLAISRVANEVLFMGWTAQLVLDNQTMVSQIRAGKLVTKLALAIAYAATLRSGLLPAQRTHNLTVC